MATITIDPVTRIEGHLKIQVALADGKVGSARVAGNLYRDFENVLAGRSAHDPVHLTQRICGVCPVSHAIAAAKTVEAAMRFKPNAQALWLRALIQAADFVQDHILHFYHLNLLDYMAGPDMPPWSGANTADLRITGADAERLLGHYIQALAVRRKGQELIAILAGKVPHIATVLPGGVTQTPSASQMSDAKGLVAELRAFVRDIYVPDAKFLADTYPDYFKVGRGPGNLLAFGVIDLPNGTQFLRRGRALRRGAATGLARRLPVDSRLIAEDVLRSYYAGPDGVPPTRGVTLPRYGKAGAYSWLKAPRYAGLVQEVGPLARMTVNGDYRGGVSVMDRTLARAYEAQKLTRAMTIWTGLIRPGVSAFRNLGVIRGVGLGMTEAPRGALGHWADFRLGKVFRYQIITPTCWNASPGDHRGSAGAIERALTGAAVVDPDRPIELMRIVHSFDPCTGCAVHVLEPKSDLTERLVSREGD